MTIYGKGCISNYRNCSLCYVWYSVLYRMLTVFYRWFCSFAVTDIGFMCLLDSHWQSQSINNDMLFSLLSLLVLIYTSIRIYMVGSPDALGVYNVKTWTFFFAHKLPYLACYTFNSSSQTPLSFYFWK